MFVEDGRAHAKFEVLNHVLFDFFADTGIVWGLVIVGVKVSRDCFTGRCGRDRVFGLAEGLLALVMLAPSAWWFYRPVAIHAKTKT